VSKIRKSVKAGDQDAVVLVAALKERCRDALSAVVDRAQETVKGVPAETRTPLPNGTSKYARPRPGSSRMYPETDVRPVQITDSRLKTIKKNMPETIEEREQRFIKEYGLSNDLSYQITRSINLSLFEQIVKETGVSPTLIAATLENTVVSLHRDRIPTENLKDDHFIGLFQSISQNEISSEAIPDVLTHLANNPESDIQQAVEATGLGMASDAEVEKIIKKLVKNREDFIRKQGERSIGALMGSAMKELRGKADGKMVNKLLRKEIQKLLNK
jgi:glutamyl-tRNA(Gln) amidotransferase subunit E